MVEILGTIGDDSLPGEQGNDSIFGLEGDDTIFSQEGDDLVFGNQGADRIAGNQGNDTLFGGQGDDGVFGVAGNDLIFGNKGADIIDGNEGNDTLFGGLGDDRVFGSAGNDLLHGDKGFDLLAGAIQTGDLNVPNIGFGEIDTLIGGEGGDVFYLGFETQSFYIGLGNNDFALIVDFIPGQDIIFASAVNVTTGSISNLNLDSLGSGVGIFNSSGDLVGFVQGLTANQVRFNVEITITPPLPL